jgi:MFS family permease
MVAQTVFAFGVSVKSWPIMYLGRILYGFGDASTSVTNSTILSEWFGGRELAFAFGVNLSLARVGTVVNNLLSPVLAGGAGVVFACWMGVIVLGGSVFSVVCMFPMDRQIEAAIASNAPLQQTGEKQSTNTATTADSEPDRENSKCESDAAALVAPSENWRDSLMHVFHLPLSFWILTVSCVLVYGKHAPHRIIIIIITCHTLRSINSYPALTQPHRSLRLSFQ